MSESTNAVVKQSGELTVQAQPTVAEMLQRAIRAGVTSDSAKGIETLAALYERMQDRDAAKEFAQAFVRLQSEIPVIVAKSVIPNRGKYERFEDVMEVVGPLLVKHGFSVSFSNGFDGNRIIETCHLSHISGHTRSNSFAVRTRAKADTETQADTMTATTAKRNALLNALNVVIRQDCLTEEHDPRMDGGNITTDQANELCRMVLDSNSDEQKFLKFAGVTRYAEIPQGKFESLKAALQRKVKP